MQSAIQQLGIVPFPAFTGERVYMREFRKLDGLPSDLSRWQDTVDAMLNGVDSEGPIYIMVDQGVVRAATTHRRPGVHVDGYWDPGIKTHGGHRASHIDRRTPPPEPPPPIPYPRHSLQVGGQHGHRINGAESELLIIAADVLGCRAYVGEYDGQPAGGGDCAHVDVRELLAVDLEPYRAWAGDTLTMLHEAIPVERDCLRTVVRLNVPA